uniref:Peptidase S1 domain-containing protein n=1 Tax=Panagrellus redivivus TaxID=6233 RepID=A0A7E4UYN9_PANRE
MTLEHALPQGASNYPQSKWYTSVYHRLPNYWCSSLVGKANGEEVQLIIGITDPCLEEAEFSQKSWNLPIKCQG